MDRKVVRFSPLGWGGDRLSQIRPIPRSPDGDNNKDNIFSDVMAQKYHQTILISMTSYNTNNFSRKPFT